MPDKKFPFFKNNTDGNSADSVEANNKFVPNDKRIVIHCENYHEVIHGQSYQKLRFDIDAPTEFIEHVLSDFEKPKLKAKPCLSQLVSI